MTKQKWQPVHEKQGYEVECLRSGQVRRYGETVYEFTVRDLTGERSEKEVRLYCTTTLKPADDPRKHPLQLHLRHFSKRADGSYRYVCGHEYTG